MQFALRATMILVLTLGLGRRAGAQWVQTNAPDTGTVRSIVATNTTLFAAIRGATFSSTNSGTTWEAADTSLTYPVVNVLTNIGGIVFASTSGWGIYQTSDDGQHWVRDKDSGLTNLYVYPVMRVDSLLYCGTLQGVFRSKDYGGHWELAGADAYWIQSLATLDTFVFGGNGGWGVFRGAMSGGTWVLLNYGLPSGLYALEAQDGYVIAATTNGVYRSSNFGTDWSLASTCFSISACSMTRVSGRIFVGTTDGAVFFSDDSGTNWYSASEGFFGGTVNSLCADQTYLYAGSNNGVWRRPLSEFNTTTVVTDLAAGWNLVSLAVVKDTATKSALYPSAVSEAFAYQGSYVVSPALQNGLGYWLRFSGAQSTSLTGTTLRSDTVNVATGWNMIGSISSAIPVAAITSDPGGITTSKFFHYNGSYNVTDTLYPGYGYWVKVSQDGKIILAPPSCSPAASADGTIRVVTTNELPPPPPLEIPGAVRLPDHFVLEQSYPNPFNPATAISYQLPSSAHVILKVYNLVGQEIATLVNGFQQPGYKTASFDGSTLPSGIYLYRLTAGPYTEVKKMVLLK